MIGINVKKCGSEFFKSRCEQRAMFGNFSECRSLSEEKFPTEAKHGGASEEGHGLGDSCCSYVIGLEYGRKKN